MHVWLLECEPSSEAFEYPPPPIEATGAKAGLFEGIWGEAVSWSLFQRRGNMSRL